VKEKPATETEYKERAKAAEELKKTNTNAQVISLNPFILISVLRIFAGCELLFLILDQTRRPYFTGCPHFARMYFTDFPVFQLIMPISFFIYFF
jgi:hypothetical protein